MAEHTNISWCDSTWNPWIGCTKISDGCTNCYAKADSEDRKHRVVWGAGQARSRTSAAYWKQPLKWNSQPFFQCASCGWRGSDKQLAALEDGRCCSMCDPRDASRRVFCASLADVFDNEVDPKWRRDLFYLIAGTPSLDWLLLTKRIGNAARLTAEAIGPGWMPPNVWLGATIVNQEEADRDIPKLLVTPARVRFLSMEPLLGPVDLTNIGGGHGGPLVGEYHGIDALTDANIPLRGGRIDLVICGGESGAKAREFDIAWPRSIVAQCKAAGVPVFMKQMGANPVWADPPDDDSEPPHAGRIKYLDRNGRDWSEWPQELRVRQFPEIQP